MVMKEISKEKFNRTKDKAEELYRELDTVNCAYFKEEVHFNRLGLDHIKFKKWNRSRPIKDQYMRLRLLHLAPQVLKLSRTVQGMSYAKEFIRKKVHSRWDNILTNIYYWEFVAIIDEVRVRVVVRQIEGGVKHFWSIIPFWQNDKNGNRKMIYKNPNN